MIDRAAVKLAEARALLDDALARAERDDGVSPTLALSYATHAVILCVDALCHRHSAATARRHSELGHVFLELIRAGRIPETASSFRELIARAMSQRARFEYQGELASRGEAKRFVGQVRRLYQFVEAHPTSPPP